MLGVAIEGGQKETSPVCRALIAPAALGRQQLSVTRESARVPGVHVRTRNQEVSGTRDTCEETKEAIVSLTGPGPHPAGFHENKASK